jgi:hypothetical protein
MNYDPYPIRFRPDERAMLKELARRLERRESETVRVLVRGAYDLLVKQEAKERANSQKDLQPV